MDAFFSSFISKSTVPRPKPFSSATAPHNIHKPLPPSATPRKYQEKNSHTISSSSSIFAAAAVATDNNKTKNATAGAAKMRKGEAAAPSTSLAATLCSALEGLINNFIEPPPTQSSMDPNRVLAGNFAPVHEPPPTECPIIEGTLPSFLHGSYIRNGPNPQYITEGPYHLLEGDGMLHSLTISKDKATFCSRYVKTYKFNPKHDAGAPIFPNFFSAFSTTAGALARGALFAARLLTGQFNPKSGLGVANNSLAFFGGRLYALWEFDLPYAVRVTPEGDIETIGRWDFDGKLSKATTAHPKLDAETGEVFAFRYDLQPPYLTLFRFDSKGSKLPDMPVFSLLHPAFIHDFAITQRYAKIPDMRMVVNPPKMMLRGKSVVGLDPGKVPRLGVIPRNATSESEMRWFQVPGLNLGHIINAWEEGDDVVLVGTNMLSIERGLEQMELIHCRLEMVRIELKTGKVRRRTVSLKDLEFGVINPEYVGRKNRYLYMGLTDPLPKICGVVKVDMEGGVGEVVRLFGAGCYGGEPFFMERDHGKEDAAEDDGYVISYVHDENQGESKFVVMDAQSPTLEVVASVKLPQRVPYGLHGLFVREQELDRQLDN